MCTLAVHRVFGFLAAMLVTVSTIARGGTVYISTTGNDANDGLSWRTAKKMVQEGLNTAQSGDQVWVAAGTYVENITLKAEVALYGGFAGTETALAQRNWVTNVTILDGNQAGIVVTCPNGASATTRIDGFTIRNGNAKRPYSVLGYGGGILSVLSAVTIANNRVMGNCADVGGGISCLETDSARMGPTITNNIITGNYADYGGGGIDYEITGSATIANNTVVGNVARNGGGIYVACTQVTIVNSIIAFNSSGVYCDTDVTMGPWPRMSNNCVYGNVEYNYSGFFYVPVHDDVGIGYNPEGKYGNIAVDPLFVMNPSPGPDGTWATADDDYGDLHLLADSPCINTGDPAYVPAPGGTDMDDQPRKMGAQVDIGADEFCWTGDANFDSYVNVGDLQLLVAAWHATPADASWNPAADFDHNNLVNIGDLQLLIATWGKSS